jgi:hypothetical protein
MFTLAFFPSEVTDYGADEYLTIGNSFYEVK